MGPGYVEYDAPPVMRRRRRWPWVLLVTVLVLGGLFVAADRIALSFAESKAADALQSSQGLQQKPDVSVTGFPFLTQLAAGEFAEVTVDARDVQVGSSRTLRVQSVDVDLHHVTVSNSYRTVHAATATADARIGYDDLSRTLGTRISSTGDGRLVAKPTVTVLGQTVSGTVSAVVHASSQDGITFTDPKVTVAGASVPAPVTRALAAVFSKAVSLSGLPFHVRVDGVEATPSALVLHLSGKDLSYSRS
jgi:hypothetical protein